VRRPLLLVAVLALLLPMGDVRAQAPGGFWTCSLDNLNDAYTLCAEKTESGTRRYITDVIAQSTTAVQDVVNIAFEATAACGGLPTDAQLFPSIPNVTRFIAAANTAAPTVANLKTPLIVPAGKNLCVIGGATSTVTVQLSGRFGP